jgi:hypothetical protein
MFNIGDKASLIKFIESMPDNLFVQPLQYDEIVKKRSDPVPLYKSGDYGGIYQWDVENVLTLRLEFKTRVQGEFRRTYMNPDGDWRNCKRVL